MSRLFLLAPAALIALLSGCASEPPAATQVSAATPQANVQPRGPALHGQLLGASDGADVELALLAVDARGRPTATLSSQTLRARGGALPFALPLPSRDNAATGERLELRARVSQSGRLVQRLPHKPINALAEQQLGSLQLVSAP